MSLAWGGFISQAAQREAADEAIDQIVGPSLEAQKAGREFNRGLDDLADFILTLWDMTVSVVAGAALLYVGAVIYQAVCQ